MNKAMLCLIIIMSITGLFSQKFDFLGIQSGMTKEEVKVLIEYDKLSTEGTFNPKSRFDEKFFMRFGNELYTDNNFSNIFTDYPALFIYFIFTEDNILWKIEVYFSASSILDKNHFINNIAKELALEECFPNAEIELLDVSQSEKRFVVIFEDDEILNKAINKKKDEFINSFK